MVGHFILESDLVVCFRDAYPVNPGHVHIVPRRHTPDFFDLSGLERDAMFDMVEEVRKWLAEEFAPDGYNIGLNIGEAAGQTVPHAHLHVIPRYLGDVDDPRGGMRWVHPDRAPYWTGRVVDEPVEGVRNSEAE